MIRDVFRVEEAAQMLDCKPTTIREMLKSGRLRGFRIGRCWRIEAEAMREYKRSNSTQEMSTTN